MLERQGPKLYLLPVHIVTVCLFAYVSVVGAVFFENMCSVKVFSVTDSVMFPSQHVCVV